MASRWIQIGAVLTLAVGISIPAAHAQSRQVVEKIPIQHIDARIVGLVLGAAVLPTEDQLFFQRLQGGGGFGYGFASGQGGYGGGYAASPQLNALPTSGSASGTGATTGGRAPWFTQPGAAGYTGPSGVLVDPGTNSVLIRP